MSRHTYGWIKTPPEIYASIEQRSDDSSNLPAAFTLLDSGFLPPVFDQGQLGSCTANSIGAAWSFALAKNGGAKGVTPSRLFIYWNERKLNGTTSQDSGATIHDSVRALTEWGAPPESDWPYDIEVFTHKPPAKAYTDGKTEEAVKYQTVAADITAIKAALVAGFPVAIGFTVYDSFESQTVAETGIVPMPAPGESVLGGHAVLVVGYDDNTQRFKTRNSWGPGWGQAGYFDFPYTYLADPNLSSDWWTVEALGKRKGAARFPA